MTDLTSDEEPEPKSMDEIIHDRLAAGARLAALVDEGIYAGCFGWAGDKRFTEARDALAAYRKARK
jgi:hypothetical protein